MMAFGRQLRLPEPAEYGSVVLAGADVSVRRGGDDILHGVDIDVRAGEVVGILGPNGAGKSTLLGALSGDLTYRGAITVSGREVGAWGGRALALRRAVLRQSNPLSFPFPVLDVVKMGRAPWRGMLDPDTNNRIVAEELVRTDTMRFIERVFTSLSGGERARVALARAMAQRAGILLLDEPSAALDINYQEQVLALARWYARRGNAVVIVLHDLAAAAAYTDRILLLQDGRSRAFGTPEEVLTAELLSEVYEHPIRVGREPDGELIVLPVRFADEGPRHGAESPADAGPPRNSGSPADPGPRSPSVPHSNQEVSP